MNKKLTLWSIGLFLALSWQAQALPTIADSIGVEKKDGKRFILHRVEEGQTLYSIARRYNTSVEFIQQANPALSNSVLYNQVIRIPTIVELSRKETRALEKAARDETKAVAARPAKPNQEIDANGLYKPDNHSKADAKAAKQQTEDDAKAAHQPETEFKKNPGFHIVEAGQTLYSLSVRYNVLLADLRKWNKLSSDNLQLGQELIVSEKAFLARQPTSPQPTTPVPPKIEAAKSEWSKVDNSKNEPAKPEPTRPEPVKVEPIKVPTTKPERSLPEHTAPNDRPAKSTDSNENSPASLPAKGRRISEIGMADIINANDPSSKYLALHRTAPVGSLVQVRNDINNSSLWVKVIGKLPDTGVNDRILIKLSARAFEKLSPNQQRFRAEVSYLVP